MSEYSDREAFYDLSLKCPAPYTLVQNSAVYRNTINDTTANAQAANEDYFQSIHVHTED